MDRRGAELRGLRRRARAMEGGGCRTGPLLATGFLLTRARLLPGSRVRGRPVTKTRARGPAQVRRPPWGPGSGYVARLRLLQGGARRRPGPPGSPRSQCSTPPRVADFDAESAVQSLRIPTGHSYLVASLNFKPVPARVCHVPWSRHRSCRLGPVISLPAACSNGKEVDSSSCRDSQKSNF